MVNRVYLKQLTSGFLAMLAGSQVVHLWYRPDLSIPEIPPKKGELHTQLYMPLKVAREQAKQNKKDARKDLLDRLTGNKS